MRTLRFMGMRGCVNFDAVHEVARVGKETATLGVKRAWPSCHFKKSISNKIFFEMRESESTGERL